MSEEEDIAESELIRGEDGVLRQREGEEFVFGGEEEFVASLFAHIDHDNETDETPACVYLKEDPESEPLPARAGEVNQHRNSIASLKVRIAEMEGKIATLRKSTVVIRGKQRRIDELQEDIASSLEEIRMLQSTLVTVDVIHRSIHSGTVCARRPRDPNKVC